MQKETVTTLLVSFMLAAGEAFSETNSAMVPLKSEPGLPYYDMRAFTYVSEKMDALWLLVPPFLESESDLSNALFQFNNLGMTAEILRSSVDQLPLPDPGADGYARNMQLHMIAADGLLSNLSQSADYGTALVTKLKQLSLSDPGLLELRKKVQQLSFGKGSTAKVPEGSGKITEGKPKVYVESVNLSDLKSTFLAMKLQDLARNLKDAIQVGNAALYERTASQLAAIVEEGNTGAERAKLVINGYHVNNTLKGFPIDPVMHALFSNSAVEAWSLDDTIDLNKIIMLSRETKPSLAIIAGLMLIRATVEKNPDQRYLITSRVLKRLIDDEQAESLLSDVVNTAHFGNAERVKEASVALLNLWK